MLCCSSQGSIHISWYTWVESTDLKALIFVGGCYICQLGEGLVIRISNECTPLQVVKVLKTRKRLIQVVLSSRLATVCLDYDTHAFICAAVFWNAGSRNGYALGIAIFLKH